MEDKTTRWTAVSTIILLLLYGSWAWSEHRSHPDAFPWEPVIAAIASGLLIAGIVFQVKERQNAQEHPLPPQRLHIPDALKERFDFAMERGATSEVFNLLDSLTLEAGQTAYYKMLKGNWNRIKTDFSENTISHAHWSETDSRTRKSILDWTALSFAGDAGKRISNVSSLVFLPQLPLFRWLFRYFPVFDRKKAWFTPLINKERLITLNEIRYRLQFFQLPKVKNYPPIGIGEVAKEVHFRATDALQRRIAKDIISYFVKGILPAEKSYFILIEGDSGMGKTTLLQKIFCEYAQTYPSDPMAFVYAGERTLAYLKAIPNPGHTILFLDAYDEDIMVRKDVKAAEHKFIEVLKTFKKVILSCRTQLFTSMDQEPERVERSLKFGVIELDGLGVTEAQKYIAHKYADHAQDKEKALKIFNAQKDVFRKPLLLSWFDELVKSPTTHYHTLFQVYETIVNRVAEREDDVVQEKDFPQRLITFSKELAIEQYKVAQKEIRVSDIKKIAEHYRIPTIDAQSRSFLARDREADYFRFTHDSFLDYFLALALFDQDIREEHFNFDQYETVKQFYTEMCWLKYARTEKVPVTAEGSPQYLDDDDFIEEKYHPYISLVPNMAFRAIAIRERMQLRLLLNNKNSQMQGESSALVHNKWLPAEIYWTDYVFLLKSVCRPEEKTHYIFKDYETVATALRNHDKAPTEAGLYVNIFVAEEVFRRVLSQSGTLDLSGTSLSCVMTGSTEYLTLLPPSCATTDFGEILSILFQDNIELAQLFRTKERIVLNGLHIKDIRFLAYRWSQPVRARVLDLRNNRIDAGKETLKPLLELPELRELYLSDNPLPPEILPMTSASGGNCLRALREVLLAPPDMVRVGPGTFTMGQPNDKILLGKDWEGNIRYSNDEQPPHKVELKGFYLAKYAVTVGEFRLFAESGVADLTRGAYVWKVNRPQLSEDTTWIHQVDGHTLQDNDRHPVIFVSWNEAVLYCNWLSEQHQLQPAYTIQQDMKDKNNHSQNDLEKWTVVPVPDANGYRLPTEAEWEYAAKGGPDGGAWYYAGAQENAADHVAWHRGNSEGATHPVGQKIPVWIDGKPLFDLIGNVFEWCWDWYGKEYYAHSPDTDPYGPDSGSDRVCRGGSWGDVPQNCRVAGRNSGSPGDRLSYLGFRLARTL